MKDRLENFSVIRREYPEYISKDQFYRLAHISKSTALYLLRSGLVPCEDSGKKTRRYKLHMDDVIFYLMDREVHPYKYSVPAEWRQSRAGNSKKHVTADREQLEALTDVERIEFCRYIRCELIDFDDLLTIAEAAKFTGYSASTVNRWRTEGGLKSLFASGKNLVPKECLAVFFCSPYCCNIAKKSMKHKRLIRTYLERLRMAAIVQRNDNVSIAAEPDKGK